jgi:serine/threonine protein kinase
MAPEMFLHDKCAKPCDIWSLGLVFFEMASGKHPFASSGLELELSAKITDDEPPRLGEDCCRGIRDLVSLMLVREDQQRATADQLLDHDFVQQAGSSDAEAALGRWLTRLKDLDGPTGRVSTSPVKDESMAKLRTGSTPSSMRSASSKGSCLKTADRKRLQSSTTVRKSVSVSDVAEVIEVVRSEEEAAELLLSLEQDDWVSVEQWSAVKHAKFMTSFGTGVGHQIRDIDGTGRGHAQSSGCGCCAGFRAIFCGLPRRN